MIREQGLSLTESSPEHARLDGRALREIKADAKTLAIALKECREDLLEAEERNDAAAQEALQL